MEILRKGSLPGEERYQTTCTHCKTVFTFLRKEARSSSDPRDGNAMAINCPLPGCGSQCWVNPTPPRNHTASWYDNR